MIKLNKPNNILTKIEENKRKKERKEKLMLMGCRSLDSPPPFALCFLFSSSSTFFNGGLREFLSYPMNTHPLMNQINSPFKGKSKQQPSHKRVENEGSQKNRRNPGRGTATTAVAATTVWPWLPPRLDRGGHWPLRLGCARYDAFCLFALIRGLLILGYLHWA